MGSRFQHLWRDERGMSFVWVGMGFMAFFAATTLAIDVGMFMTAKSQAQNAADAGALAGATALVFDDYDDRSDTGPAKMSAMNVAKENDVMRIDVSVLPADVTFPLSPSGANNRVHVNVFRTSDRANPVAALIGPIFGVPTVNVSAQATAEASPANAMSCVKPFTIPDRWEEHTHPTWDPGDTFERYDDHTGLPVVDADVYNPPGHPSYSGYNPTRDKGLALTLREGMEGNIEPSFYFSWAMPGGTGGSWYEENIYGCNGTNVHIGDPITQEPGAMVGPTGHGVDALIARDPTAYWDDTRNRVVSTMRPSPRVFPIPLYDPDFYQLGRVSGRPADLKVANWIGFFVTGRSGAEVYGRITPIQGIIDGDAGPAPSDTFPKVIRLVE
jgi:Flp pilus assembly protein TadG